MSLKKKNSGQDFDNPLERINGFESNKSLRKKYFDQRQSSYRFEMVGVKLASPQKICEWSQRLLPTGEIVGEILVPDSISYRTGRPEPTGLLCEKIFGPLRSWECACGEKASFLAIQPRRKRLYCEICDVEFTENHVRRHRMGNVNLHYPITHAWYLKGSPSYLSLILNTSLKELKTIIYLEKEEKTPEQALKELEDSFEEEYFNLNKDSKPKNLVQHFIDKKEWQRRLSKKTKSLKVLFYFKQDELKWFAWQPKPQPPIEWYPPQGKNMFTIQNKIFRKKRRKLRRKNQILRIQKKKILKNWFNDQMTVLLQTNHGSVRLLNMVRSINLRKEMKQLRQELIKTWLPFSKLKPFELSTKKRTIRRLRLIESFLATKTNPSWMILKILPVLPAGLRPVVELPNGVYMSSEFNDHYQRIITRNNRLLKFCEQMVPEFIVVSEKLLIQDAVDDLIDNSSRYRKEARTKPLRCLTDILAGKEGRFRQNLLGKRVDFSGRSVIVVGPTLMLDQCGLPYEMAINLISPYLFYKIKKYVEYEIGEIMDSADMEPILQRNYPFIWSLLTLLLSVSLVLLNRAPTLHRFGIQAFRPLLSPVRAIQLHPLVCPGFNADFDGDQMGVHLPLTRKTQLEAYRLLSPNNLLSPATGRPILNPSQDIVMGWYYLTTRTFPNNKGANRYFTTFSQISEAIEQEKISMHSWIWLKYSGKIAGMKMKGQKIRRTEQLSDNSFLEIFDDFQIKRDKDKKIISAYLRTTPGRILINELLAAAIFARPLEID